MRLTVPLKPSPRTASLPERAQALRAFPTLSERKLWQALAAGQLGVSFRRQVPLGGRFIADFFAPSLGLVVEVDGSIHRRRRAADVRRDQRLRRLGYCILRIPVEVVMRDLDSALLLVRDAIAALRR